MLTRYFFQPQDFECKQADIEQINNKVPEKLLYWKSRPGRGGGGGEGFVYLVFIYT